MGDLRLLDEARRKLRAPSPDEPLFAAPRAQAPPDAPEAVSYPVWTPKQVLPHPRDLDCLVAWDTETSGLHIDDDARTAIVSVAFCRKETPELVESYAFPFDQGRAADKGFTIQRDKRGAPKGLTNAKAELPLWLWDQNLGKTEWDDLMRWLKLAGELVGLVGANVKFDIPMTAQGTRHFPGVMLEPFVVWDTMLASANLWPGHPMGLKPTMSRLYGKEEGEEAAEVKEALATVRKLYGLTGDNPRYDLLPWDVIGPYATKDAEQTLRLTKRQALEFYEEANGDWHDAQRAMDLMRVLARIEWRGFGPLDVDRATEVAEALEKRVAQLEAAMPYQPPTAYRAKEYYFDHLGLKPWKGAEEHRVIEMVPNKKGELVRKVTKQGTLTIDVLNRLAAAGVPFAAESAELSRIKTANNMQYRGYVNLASPIDRRMRPTYKQAFVRSGRMSVERWQGQAIPRRDSIRLDKVPGMSEVPHPRDLFLVDTCDCADCGGAQMRRVTIDLSQAELRVAFKQSGCTLGIEQIQAGRDIHGEMATQVFHVTKDQDEDEFKHYRYIAKRGVFGGIFMVGTKTFRDTIWKLAGIDLPWQTAKDTVYGFRGLYPEIEKAYNQSMAEAERDGFVVLQDGTKSYFGPRDFSNTAWNRKVQGSLALFNAEWLIEAETRSAHFHNGRGALVLTIHDSITLDLPPSVADAWLDDLMAWTNRHFEETFGIVGACDLEEGF